MRIVITGGAGFVGSKMALSLKRKHPGYVITAFDNLKRRGSEINLSILKSEGIEFIHGDIRSVEDFEQLPKYDLMIEASAEPSVLAGLNSSPNYVINNNFNGSINCFNNCVKNKARLIFLSTSRVYPFDKIECCNIIESGDRFDFNKEQYEAGISANGLNESFSLDGVRSFYGATKLASELFLKEYSKFYSLDFIILRFGVIGGPGQMGKTDQGVAGLWMARHYWRQSLSYIGFGGLGKQVRDILHVEDACDLIELMINRFEDFKNDVYNAGGGLLNSVSLRQLTNLCQELTGNILQIDSILDDRQADLRCYITDNSKLTSQSGWSPKRSVSETLTDVYNWIYENEQSLKSILL